jgi:hypothetical protein
MPSHKSKNLDKMYKRTNNAIINSQKDIDPKRMRGCLSKVGYDTEFEAEVNGAKRRLYHYKCLYCPHYHLTRKEQ